MRKDREEILKEVMRIQKDWQYRCVVKTKEIEAWECKSPETVNYAFLISMSRWGITVCGDITSPLVFRVGVYRYGMPFLAHNSVESYMLEKLDHTSKRDELDEEQFQEIILEQIARRIDDVHGKYLRDRLEKKYKTFLAAKPYIQKLVEKMVARTNDELWCDLDEIFFAFPCPENPYDAYRES